MIRGLVAGVVFGMLCLTGYGQSRALLNYSATDSFSIPMGDSTALALVGNVVLHHNGAILVCDSAVRYNPNYMEFFDNVIINKDSTYIYGDRADIDGITNLAKVYAPIIKTVDGDMTMYSTTMEFNTLTKIGRFTRGGTISQKDNLIEAVEGIYHVDQRDIFFVGNVAMRNEEYLIKTDSMGYNFDTEISAFYLPAQIWNKDGDFLSANRGYYDRINDVYNFEENSYILTNAQEIFADSITYMKTAGIVSLFGNAQIHDQEQKTYLFGDYGIYWVDAQQAIMSENPSAMGYDDEGEQPDSVYVRGDILMMHTFPSEKTFNGEIASSLVLPRRDQLDSLRIHAQDQFFIQRPDSLLPDSLSNWAHLYGAEADSTLLGHGMRGIPSDSLQVPGLFPDSLQVPGLFPDSLVSPVSAGEYINQADSLTHVMPDSTHFIRMDDLPLDSLSHPTPENTSGGSPAMTEDSASTVVAEGVTQEKPKTKREIRRELRLERRKAKIREYAVKEGIIPAVDTLTLADSLPQTDSLFTVDSIVDTTPQDSLQRVLRAFNNVKIFRHDMQAVCDSLVAFSLDSTVHMHVKPVLWNEENQVTAEIIHIFSRDEQLYRADFEKDPVMSQWVIDSLFNQVTGDRMEAYFENNNIRRLLTLNNAKSYYYLQENNPEEIGGFLDLKSQDIFFIFDDSMRIEFIKANVNPEETIYPMEKIPADHTQRFPNFKWLPHLRPQSHREVCDREFRPSVREASESIPYPQFKITERIEADKKRYIGEGIWSDRTDTIWFDPTYFDNITN